MQDMLLQRTISQLDIGYLPQDQARKLGHMGYLQWLGALPGQAGYRQDALRALEMAQPFRETSPAVAVFCQLLMESCAQPPVALEVILPGRSRRGGSTARRKAT